jgi:glycosyltransferase involved in cell wall biosynthesis
MNLTVVVCTHNPDPSVLARTLCSISDLDRGGAESAECLIIDNNSKPPVAVLPGVQNFLHSNTWARIVREDRQGLSYARIRGIAESLGDVLVFFDDDNEPDRSYLAEVSHLFSTHADVGVWGPGSVDVEFLGATPDWVRKSCRHMFQERHAQFTEYACVRTPWMTAFPAGTGLSVRRSVMRKYADRVADGSCSATDRKGKSLASAGDGQIVHTAILMGLACGVHPHLKVRHLIPETRCNEEYLSRLCYGVSASLLPAAVESFPELLDARELKPPSWALYQWQSWSSFLRGFSRVPSPMRRVITAARAGEAVGRFTAAGRPVPRWLDRDRASFA